VDRVTKDGCVPPALGGFAPWNALHWLKEPYAFLETARRRCGLTFALSLPVVGRGLITGAPDLVAETIRNRDLIGGRGTQALRPVLGANSLIILEGKRHAEHRRCLAPAFRGAAASTFDELTVSTARQTIAALPGEGSFSIQEVVRDIGLRVIIRVLFGELSSERETTLMGLTRSFMDSFRSPAVLFLKGLHLKLGSLSPWGRFLRNRDRLRAFVGREIHACRGGCGGGLLAEVVAGARGPAMDDEALFEELLSLLLFGHDTAAAALAWVFHHAHSDEDVLNRLTEEARSFSSPLEMVEANEPPYLRACIKESMRLCPVVVHLTRVARCETRVGDISLRAGDRVLPCAYLAQRNPEVFPNPEGFQPERFMVTPQVSPWSYFPFGLGKRKCIGAPFAERQMELILATFMQEAELEPDGAYPVRPVREMLLIVPHRGTMMRIRRQASG